MQLSVYFPDLLDYLPVQIPGHCLKQCQRNEYKTYRQIQHI